MTEQNQQFATEENGIFIVAAKFVDCLVNVLSQRAV